MVRSLLFHGPGQPLALARLADPEPHGAEIVVRVSVCTLCRSDLHTHAGRRTEATPTVLGHEIVGRIEAFGPTAAHVDAAGVPVKIGDRVTWAVVAGCGECFYCIEDLPQKCARPFKYGHEHATNERPFGGGLADVVVLVSGTAMFRVPDAVSDRVAAPANCAFATAAGLLRHGGPVIGRHVLVLGAGVLGVTICAMARAHGAMSLTVCDPDLESLKRASLFGATHNYRSDDSTRLAARIANRTQGRGFDVVFEVAGVAATVQAALQHTRIGGTVVLAGTVAPVGNVAFDPEQVVRRMLTIKGVHNYHPRDLQTALAFLAGPGRQFPFESLIAAEYPLDRADEAFSFAQAHAGVRVCIIP